MDESILGAVPETREPAGRKFNLKELSVTQYVSFLLYLTLFSMTLMKYNIERGFGCVDKGMVTKTHPILWKFSILWLICFGSAIRIYLSFWNVEGSKDFQALRKDWRPLAKRLDWLACRSGCFLSVNLLPIAVAGDRCGWIEGLLVASYFLMFTWDVWIGIALCRKSNERWCRFLNVEGIVHNLWKEDFKYKVGLWTILEFAGLLMSILYVVLVVRGTDVEGISFALGGLSLVTFLIIFVDILVFNIKDYLETLIWCLLGLGPVILLVNAIG